MGERESKRKRKEGRESEDPTSSLSTAPKISLDINLVSHRKLLMIVLSLLFGRYLINRTEHMKGVAGQ